MMKHTLIQFSGIALFLAALGCAGPAWAQTEGLEFCADHDDYPHYVTKLLIEIPSSEGVPADFDLAIGLDGKTHTIPVKRKADDTDGWWRGQAPEGFKLKKIDLRPKIPGFTVRGPESCQYQVIEVKKDVEECAAWYRFRVHQVKLVLQADPPEAAVRLTPGAGSIRNPDVRCVLPRSGPRHPTSAADAQLAAKVQAALDKDDALDSFIIRVTAQGGKVYLSGLVNSEDAKKKAAAKAKAAGARNVENNLRVVSLYDGTALMDVDKSTITIERVKGGDVVFTATLERPADFLSKPEWTVSRELLEKANAGRFARSAATQQDHTAGWLQKELNDLGNIQSITIKRFEW